MRIRKASGNDCNRMFLTGLVLDLHGRSARAHHQHAATAADRNALVVEVDPDDRVAAALPRLLDHLADRDLFRLPELLFIGRGAPAYDVANPGEKVPEDVRPENGLAGNEPEVFSDLPAFDGVGRENEHGGWGLMVKS